MPHAGSDDASLLSYALKVELRPYPTSVDPRYPSLIAGRDFMPRDIIFGSVSLSASLSILILNHIVEKPVYGILKLIGVCAAGLCI